MSRNLQKKNVDELVDLFASVSLAQDEALLDDDLSKVNRLFLELEAIEAELKRREGDQRTSLLRLYEHPNAQVRVKAVKATLAVAPRAAREKLEAIANSREYPQAGEAGMSIRALDEGIFKPT
jgi:uncharacterized protein DUF2019